jgi:hypothetical protein
LNSTAATAVNIQMAAPVAHTLYATSSATSGTLNISTLKANAMGLIITGAGGTTLTIQLPAGAGGSGNPTDGTMCFVASQGAFTTVTWQDNGGTSANVIGGQSAIGGTNRGQKFIYSQPLGKWLAI